MGMDLEMEGSSLAGRSVCRRALGWGSVECGMGWDGFVDARLKERVENVLRPSGDVIRLRPQVFPP